MKRIMRAVVAVCLLGGVLGLTRDSRAAVVSFGDPYPGGIGYEWLVQMEGDDSVKFERHVGAKSWNEPGNPVGLKGWTHTSDWVMLELLESSMVILQIEREKNVPASPSPARNKLYPAFSLYAGWDNDDDNEDHQYNNIGNTPWAEDLNYLIHDENDQGAAKITAKLLLPAGQYSLAIGGNPPAREIYPAGTCDPSTDRVCYTYTGRHGYKVKITTRPAPGLYCPAP